MQTLFIVLLCVILALIAAAHAVSAFWGGTARRIAAPVGLLLHLFLYFDLLLLGAQMKYAVLAFMGSVALLSVLSLVAYNRGKKKEGNA